MPASSDPWTIRVPRGPSGIDADEVRRALALLVDPDATHEIRALPSGKSRVVRGNDLTAAVKAVEELSDGTGMYVTLNPVRPDLEKAASNGDVLRRCHLLVDCDPRRPTAKDSNSSEEEHETARGVAVAIMGRLTADGWPLPAVVDSGNGWHLLYRVDLPNDEAARKCVSGVLKALARDHGTDAVEVDVKNSNASRITKLPGTWARKGPHSEARPHRLARLVSMPSTFAAVPEALLRGLAATAEKQAPATAPPDPWTIATPTPGRGRYDSYVRTALESSCRRVTSAKQGERNNELYLAANSMGQLEHLGVTPRSEVEAALAACAFVAKLDPAEVPRTINNGYEAGKLRPWTPPDKDAPAVPPPYMGETEGGAGSEPSSLIVWASSVKPRKVEWLWKGRIPSGKLTTFAGQGGIGKTFVLCDIAARVSAGHDWPFGRGECAEDGQVLFISGEDDEDDTLVPRLIECGADLTRIAFLGPEVHDSFTLVDLTRLTAVAAQMPDLKLVVIDPPTSYLDGTDSHKDSELRGAVLTPLKHWASKHGVAVILNTHVNKGGGQNTDAAARVMGSVAWVNAVRTAHMFVRDKEDKTKVLFIPFKTNIAEPQKALVYRITKTSDDLAKVDWLLETDTSADEAMSADAKKPKLVSAKDWLIDIFTQQREWPSDQFWASAKEHGVTKYGIDEARAKLEVPKARRVVGSNGDAVYTWWVPVDWPHFRDNSARSATSE